MLRASRLRKEREYLRREFQTVCREFFPRWKGREEYKVKATWKLNLGSIGRCQAKTILIKSDGFLRFDLKKLVSFYASKTFGNGIRLTPKQALECLLIHEICHAVIRGGLPHGKRWRDRMFVASNRAKELGRKRLAESISNEAKMYRYSDRDEKKEQELQRRIRREIKPKGGSPLTPNRPLAREKKER